jgi:hypothetical protein
MTSIAGIKRISPEAEMRKSSVRFMAGLRSSAHAAEAIHGWEALCSRLGRSGDQVNSCICALKGPGGLPQAR